MRCKLARVENALAQTLLTALHASPTRRNAALAAKDAAAAEDVNAMVMCISCSSCLEYEHAVTSKRHLTALQTSSVVAVLDRLPRFGSVYVAEESRCAQVARHVHWVVNWSSVLAAKT